jgi:hypothetical protein
MDEVKIQEGKKRRRFWPLSLAYSFARHLRPFLTFHALSSLSSKGAAIASGAKWQSVPAGTRPAGIYPTPQYPYSLLRFIPWLLRPSTAEHL